MGSSSTICLLVLCWIIIILFLFLCLDQLLSWPWALERPFTFEGKETKHAYYWYLLAACFVKCLCSGCMLHGARLFLVEFYFSILLVSNFSLFCSYCRVYLCMYVVCVVIFYMVQSFIVNKEVNINNWPGLIFQVWFFCSVTILGSYVFWMWMSKFVREQYLTCKRLQ